MSMLKLDAWEYETDLLARRRVHRKWSLVTLGDQIGSDRQRQAGSILLLLHHQSALYSRLTAANTNLFKDVTHMCVRSLSSFDIN